MAVLSVRLWPDPVLTTKAKPVDVADDELRKFMEDMADHVQPMEFWQHQVGVSKGSSSSMPETSKLAGFDLCGESKDS